MTVLGREAGLFCSFFAIFLSLFTVTVSAAVPVVNSTWWEPLYPQPGQGITIYAEVQNSPESVLINFTYPPLPFWVIDSMTQNSTYTYYYIPWISPSDSYFRYQIHASNGDGTGLSGLNVISWDSAGPNTTLSVSPVNNTFQGNVYVRNGSAFTLTAADYDVDGSGPYSPSGVNYTGYQVNSGGWSNYTGPFSQGDGSYTIDYYSMDNAGNAEAVNNMTVVVDSVPPVITVESPVNGSTYNVQVIDFNVTLDDAGYGCNYTLNGNPNQTMLNESGLQRFVSNESLADGDYTVVFYCLDLALNMNATSASFQVDATPPSVEVFFPENMTSYDTTDLYLNYSASDSTPDSIWYVYNGSTIFLASWSGVENLTALDNQQSVLVLCANDTANNTNCTVVVFAVDTDAPVALTLAPPNDYNASLTVTFNLSCSDNIGVDVLALQVFNYTGSGEWDFLAANTSAGNATPWSFTSVGAFPEGPWTWRAWCNDTIGHNDTSGERNFTIDLTFPQVFVYSPVEGYGYPESNLTMNYSASDDRGLDAVWYTYGAETNFTNASDAIAFTGLENQSVLVLCANDTANNTNCTNVTFLVDTVFPNVDSAWSRSGTSVYINVSHFDYHPDYVVLHWDGSPQREGNWSGTLTQFTMSVTLPPEGQCDLHQYYVFLNDTAGNGNQTGVINVSVCTPAPPPPPSPPSGASYGGGGGPPPICQENWTCTEWSGCINGTYRRACNDTNDCGTENDRPSEVMGCTLAAPDGEPQETAGTGEPEPVCTPGERTCSGDSVQACLRDGTGWRFVEICPAGCLDGECRPPADFTQGITGLVTSPTAAIVGSVAGALLLVGGLAWFLKKRALRMMAAE